MRRTQWMALSALVVISGCTLLQPNHRLRQALAPRAQPALPAVEDFASVRQEAAAVAAREAAVHSATLFDGDTLFGAQGVEPAPSAGGLFATARLDDAALETVRGDRPLQTVELAQVGQANGRLYAPAAYVGSEITDNWSARTVTAFDAPALSTLDVRITASLVGL